MKKVLLGVLLVLAGIAANAERMDDRWVLIGEKRAGELVYIDTITITEDSAWFFIPDNYIDGLGRYVNFKQRMYFKCGQRLERTGMTVVTDSTNNLVIYRSNGNPSYEEVIPGTLGEVEYESFCLYKQRNFAR